MRSKRPKPGNVVFATFPLTNGLEEAIRHAVDAGVRCFDTAQAYGNEAAFGAAMRNIGLARAEFAVTTKIDPANYATKEFLPSLQRSLDLLRVDRVDLLLLHGPPPSHALSDVLDLLETAQAVGLTTSIGVADPSTMLMRDMMMRRRMTARVDQVDLQPVSDAAAILDAASEARARLQAYPHVWRMSATTKLVLGNIARIKGLSTNEVAQRWVLQHGVDLVTHSYGLARTGDDCRHGRVELSDTDMDRIDAALGVGTYPRSGNVISWPAPSSGRSAYPGRR